MGDRTKNPAHRKVMTDEEVEHEMRRRSRRAFIVGGASLLAGIGGWAWLTGSAKEQGTLQSFRRVLEFNETVGGKYFSASHLAPTFNKSDARMPRVNGDIGLAGEVNPAEWRLAVIHGDGNGSDQKRPPTLLTMEDIRTLPRHEMTTELKCIEGWSEFVTWGGARMIDLIARYGLGTRSGRPADFENNPDDFYRYMSIETPDRAYYVGLDMPSATHPQTLLCYDMNGAPITAGHGAPLRLAIAVKYGIKNIKRIGTIRFTDRRPKDYWAEQGYDWYAAL